MIFYGLYHGKSPLKSHPHLGEYLFLGGGFKYFWNFHPYLGKMNPFWRAYFSKGLVQPPTRFPFPSIEESQIQVFEPPKVHQVST